MGPAPALTKLCFRCGVELPVGARSVEVKGRRLCLGCAIKASAAAAPGPQEDIIPLEPEDPDAVGHRAPCPTCARPLPPMARRCDACGFVLPPPDTSPRIPQAPPAPGVRLCRNCGYDLAGLKSTICPECGAEFMRSPRDETPAQRSREMLRREFRTLAWIGAVSFVIMAGVLTLRGHWEGILWELGFMPVQVGIGTGVYMLCCAWWMGWDAPAWLAALRLTAVYFAVEAARSIFGLIPYGMAFPAGAGGLVYVHFVSELFEIEYQDAFWMGILTVVADLVLLGAIWWMVK